MDSVQLMTKSVGDKCKADKYYHNNYFFNKMYLCWFEMQKVFRNIQCMFLYKN